MSYTIEQARLAAVTLLERWMQETGTIEHMNKLPPTAAGDLVERIAALVVAAAVLEAAGRVSEKPAPETEVEDLVEEPDPDYMPEVDLEDVPPPPMTRNKSMGGGTLKRED